METDDLSPNLKALATLRTWGCTPLIRTGKMTTFFPHMWIRLTYYLFWLEYMELTDACTTLKVTLIEGQFSVKRGSVWFYSFWHFFGPSNRKCSPGSHSYPKGRHGALLPFGYPPFCPVLSIRCGFTTPLMSFPYSAECPIRDFGGRNLDRERELFSICFHSSWYGQEQMCYPIEDGGCFWLLASWFKHQYRIK